MMATDARSDEIDLSVILCTHNPRPDYLRRTLDALRAQTVPPDRWELLLVDNSSTHRLADSWDLSWHPNGRHILESQLGLTSARLRGIAEASSNLLVFVDDDNVLEPRFLEHVQEIHRAYPHLGVFGAGRLEPEFEILPPTELKPRLSMLALRTVDDALWSNNPTDFDSLPWGAGLVVTRRSATAYCKLLSLLNISEIVDRRGERLFCGGDDLFSWAAAAHGLGFGIFPQLRVTHLISAGRLTRSYFLRLMRDRAYSNGVMLYLVAGTSQSRLDMFAFGHLVFHGVRNGYFSFKCRLAEARGREDAASFLASNALRPFRRSQLTSAVVPSAPATTLEAEELALASATRSICTTQKQ